MSGPTTECVAYFLGMALGLTAGFLMGIWFVLR